LREDKIDSILKNIIGIKVTGLIHNYSDRTLTLLLGDNRRLIFYECQLIYDLGIIDCIIGDVSKSAGLGIVLELKRLNINPEEYIYCTISKGFDDIENKREIIICFKSCSLKG